MSSKKSKKRTNSQKAAVNQKNERLKHIDDEDKELDELEKIIAKSENGDNIDEEISNSDNEKSSEDNIEDENEEDDFFASLDKQEKDIKPYNERNKKKSESKFDFTSIIDLVKQNTKYAIWGSIVAVLFIALVIALAVDSGNKNSDSAKKDNKVTGNKLIKNSNKEIEELVNTYFSSLVSCDVDKLAEIMDSVENISVEALKKESEYIEEYRNIECYTKKGIAKNEYVVYVYYENKILNIETLAPGAIILYVKKDEEKGVYRIHNGISDTEIAKHISKLSEDKDIKQFNKDVDEKFKKACESDADLKAFYDALVSAAQPSSDSTEAPVSESSAEETQPQGEQPQEAPQDNQPQETPQDNQPQEAPQDNQPQEAQP